MVPSNVDNSHVLRVCMLPWSDSNPYQQLLKNAVESTGAEVIPARHADRWVDDVSRAQLDVIHFHWLHGFVVGRSGLRTAIKGSLFLRDLARVRRSVAGIVWTCHNLGNHLGWSLGMERVFVRRACSKFDRIIVHQQEAIDRVIDYFRIPFMQDRFDVVPHGHYLDWYAGSATRAEARETLKIPQHENVLLLFGQLRANKGIEQLLQAFAQLAPEAKADTRLLLIGKAEPKVADLIHQAQKHEPQIDFRNEFVPDDMVQTIHAAADLAILPFASGLTSGSLILAMGFGLPVIAAATGDAGQLVTAPGGRLVDPGDVTQLKHALEDMIAIKLAWATMGEHNRRVVSGLDWPMIGARTVESYRRAMREG